MNLNIYTVYDNKAGAYHRPFFSQSNGAAIRSLTDSVNSKEPGNMIAEHPEDYSLFHIGDWSEESGLIHARKSKHHLCDCIDLVKTENLQADLYTAYPASVDDVPSLVSEQAG